MEDIFNGILKGRVAIIGIGNILRGDDGLGPQLIRMLKDRSLENGQFLLLDTGEVPENYLERIVACQPDTIILVDALDFGGSPGSIKLIQPEEIESSGLTTHNASLGLSVSYLKSRIDCNVVLLGIQPLNLEMGSELSEPIKQALSRIEESLLKCTNSL